MIGGSERETILVVDDDGYARTLVAKILSQRGYTALPATDAWQAMDILKSSRPTLSSWTCACQDP